VFRFLILAAFFFLITDKLCSCQKEPDQVAVDKPLFDSIPVAVSVQPMINEASGIADSKTVPGFLWVEEDGGNPTQLYLLGRDGKVKKTVFLKGTTNRDWEDMVLSGSDLYVGEIGDNNASYPDYAFYKFPEPAMNVDTVQNVETIRFRYADGSHDAEAFFVEPSTKNIYIITKRDNPSRIYKLTAPLSTSSMNVAQMVGQLPYNGVVSAALSADEKEIILKTYTGLFYYTAAAGEKKETALQKTYINLPYTLEPQGEAVCFSAAGNGYFTLSELGFGSTQKLYLYKRN
jgi:hypothetical protein